MSELHQAKYELSRGVILTITPLTAFAQRAINLRAAELYPEIDRTPYEVEIEDALIPGTKMKAEQSIEWLTRMSDVFKKRQQVTIGLLLDAAVTVEDRAALIAPYQHTIDSFKDAVKGQPAGAAAGVSDFIALLLGVLAEEQEVSAIIKLAQGATPLSDAEIIDGFRFFRSMVVQRSRRFKYPDQKKSQNIQPAAERPDRSEHDGVRSGSSLQPAGRSDTSDPIGAELVRTAETDESTEGGLLAAEGAR